MIDKLLDSSGVIATILTGIIAFFGGKKMRSIDEKKANSDATEGIGRVYEKFAEQTERKFDQMDSELKEVKMLLKQYIDQCRQCENNKIK